MDQKEDKSGKESCCETSSGSCGCGGKKSCCGGKAALALVLLLIGGLVGYGIGHCHAGRMACHYGAPMNDMSQSAPVK